MKQRALFVFLIYMTSLVLTACGPQTLGARNAAPQASSALVEFTGKVEAYKGDQVVVNGQTLKLDAGSQVNSQFAVGDTVHVQAEVQSDGSVVVKEIGAPGAVALSGDPADPTATPVPSSTATPLEFVGMVESITPEQLVLAGQVFLITPETLVDIEILAGDVVKVEATSNVDGTFTALVVDLADPTATPSPTLVPPTNTPQPPGNDNFNDNGNNNDNGNDNGNGNDNSNDNDNNNDDDDHEDDDNGNDNGNENEDHDD